MITNHAEACALSQTRKRKLANNTYLNCNEDGTFGVRLHTTEIVTYQENGDITLNSGGWRTVTTKARINDFVDWYLYQDAGVWYVCHGNNRGTAYAYADGMTLHPDGTVTGEGEDPNEQKKTRKQCRKFAKDYMVAFFQGKVPAPGNGDCWGCLMRAEDGSYPLGENFDHIQEHFKEFYFVPVLLYRAIERFPVSIMAKHLVASFWAPQGDPESTNYLQGVVGDQLEKALRCLLYELTGSAV